MKFEEVLTQTVRAIYAAREKEGRAEEPRRYLGASIVGHECEMYLWLMFRGVIAQKFDGRMFRLFERGRREEAEIWKDLRSIGCEVWEKDEDGNQFGISFLGGHFRGHCDAVAVGLPEAPNKPHIIEAKTHSSKSFADLKKKGVKLAKPMHFKQMMIYMYGMDISDALYFAVNKDTDDLYTERIKLDKAEAEKIMAIAKNVIETYEPMKCATREDDYRCKMCEARTVCWHRTGAVFACETCIDCRTCCHSTPITEGEGAKWECTKGKACIIGTPCKCKEHLAIPALIAGEVDTAHDKAIVYKDAKGKQFVNGHGGYTTEELMKMPIDAAGLTAEFCEKTGGAFTGGNTLEVKYKNAKVVWRGDKTEAREYLQKFGCGKWAETARETAFKKEFYEFQGTKLVTIDTEKGVVEIKEITNEQES